MEAMGTHEARQALRDAAGYYTDDMDDLAAIVAGVLEEVDEIDLEEPYPEDRCHEIADGSVPVYTKDIFDLVPALAGYTISDPGLMPEDADIERMAQVMLYDILSNVAHQRLSARQAEQD
jgi:hypothetical protein